MSVMDVLVPTVGRADRLPGLLKNLKETAPDAHPIFVIDRGDEDSWQAVLEPEARGYTVAASVELCNGTYPVKTNAGFAASRNEFVLVSADDVVFHEGWLEAVMAVFTDPSVHVVGANDLSPMSHPEHSTQIAVRRSYAMDPGSSLEEPGKIYCEKYAHNFTETEVCGLALARGCWRYVPEAVIEHEHPVWGKRESDATDKKGNARGWEHDEALYAERMDRLHFLLERSRMTEEKNDAPVDPSDPDKPSTAPAPEPEEPQPAGTDVEVDVEVNEADDS